MLVVYNPFAFWDIEYLVWSLRAFYVFAAYAILIVRFIPDLKSRFLDYGARVSHNNKRSVEISALPRWVRIQFNPVLDWLADMTVPHNWFTHFYICSSICTAFWLSQIDFPWFFFANMSQSQIASQRGRTTWCMMLLQIQGLRRLYECLFVANSSSSRMWVGHYFIGLAFYIATNIAIWIELVYEPDLLQEIDLPVIVVNLIRLSGCTFLFVWSSVQQYKVHKYLASLKEYRVPDHPIFRDTNLICPHYSFEFNIYLAFTILTAHNTRILNLTMLCATAFVAFNLGVTADLTKKWQLQRFPKQRPEIASRARMLKSIW